MGRKAGSARLGCAGVVSRIFGGLAWLGSSVTQPRSQSATHARTYARTTAVCQCVCVPVGGGRSYPRRRNPPTQPTMQGTVSGEQQQQQEEEQKAAHTHATQSRRTEPQRNAQTTNERTATHSKQSDGEASQPASYNDSQPAASRSQSSVLRPSVVVGCCCRETVSIHQSHAVSE